MDVNCLKTKNLMLRKACIDDLNDIWNNIWKDVDISSNMLWKPILNYEDALIRLNKTIEYQSQNYAYFVCLKDSDEVIGFAGVSEISDKVFEDTGICIARNYQGRGYAKEVVSVLKKLIFEELDGKRFLYGCFNTNDKSRKVCLSQGFIYLNSENITRKWDNKEFLVDYYYFDKDMYEYF